MSPYESVVAAASELPVPDRLRLIDDSASSVPDDQPPTLSEKWLAEVERRSTELDTGEVIAEPWLQVRQRLFREHGVHEAD